MCVSCGCDCDSHYQHNINTSLSEQTKRGEGIVAVLLFTENSVTIIHHMCAHTRSAPSLTVPVKEQNAPLVAVSFSWLIVAEVVCEVVCDQ